MARHGDGAGSAAAGPAPALLAAGFVFCSLFFFHAFLLRVSPSVMVDDLMRDFAVGAAVLGNLSAIYFYTYAGLQMPVGALLDRFGPRRLVAAAAVLTAIGALLFATAEQLWLAYLGRLIIGAATAFSFVGALAMAATWFPRRFGMLGGLAQMMGAAGGVAGQAPLGLAIGAVGWRDAIMLVGAVGLVLAVAIYATVRDRRIPPTGGASLLAGLRRTVRNAQTWIAAGIGGSMTGTILAFAGLWGVPFLMQARGLDKPTAAALTSIMLVGWAIGSPLLGWLSDRFRRRKPFILLGATLSTLLVTAIILFPAMPRGLLMAALFVQGFGASSMILCFAAAREHNPRWTSGATLGVINTFVVGAGGLLQPLVGLLLDWNWDGRLIDGVRIYDTETYVAALAVLPAVGLTGLLLVFALRETHARQIEGD